MKYVSKMKLNKKQNEVETLNKLKTFDTNIKKNSNINDDNKPKKKTGTGIIDKSTGIEFVDDLGTVF